MKVQFTECEYYGEMTLTPETIEETSQLLRFSRNASAKKPQIHMSFRPDIPYCNIFIKKRDKSVQINCISPNTK